MGQVKKMITEAKNPVTDETVNITELSNIEISNEIISSLHASMECETIISMIKIRKDDIRSYIDLLKKEQQNRKGQQDDN